MQDCFNKSGVYVIANLKNECLYIGGTTTSFKVRWQQHKDFLRRDKHGNAYLQHAWNKYGECAFEFYILEVVSKSSEVDKCEQYWLDFFRSIGEVYNILPIAGRPPMQQASESTRLKMSKAHMGHPSAMKGRKHSLETKQKISQAQLGHRKSEQHKQKIGFANQGHEVSTETRQRIAEHVAKSYPAFLNSETGEVIPAGHNLKSLCEKYGLSRSRMWDVIHKRQASHKGWILWERAEQA